MRHRTGLSSSGTGSECTAALSIAPKTEPQAGPFISTAVMAPRLARVTTEGRFAHFGVTPDRIAEEVRKRL